MQTFIKVRDTLVMLDSATDESNWPPAMRILAYVAFLVAVGVIFLAMLGV